MNHLEELTKLRKQVDLSVIDIDNYPKNQINVLVSNHNCLMDIFYLPMALPEEIVSLISARLIYKKENERKNVINRYLNAMPIEAHGGSKYTDICLEHAGRFLVNGTSVSIFPEGAYVYDKKIFRGHTGASRLLYDARSIGKQVNLVPVSIYVSRNDDLDNYNAVGDTVKVTILPPVDYEEAYYNYRWANSEQEANAFLHQPIDIAMKSIASNLEIPYENNYIKLRAKGNVMFEDGSVVESGIAQKDEFVSKYNQELDDRVLKLLRKR